MVLLLKKTQPRAEEKSRYEWGVGMKGLGWGLG